MSSKKRRASAEQMMTDYFLAKGRVPSKEEYAADPDKPVSVYAIRSLFNTYGVAIGRIQKANSEVNKMVMKAAPELPKFVVEKPKMEAPKPKPVKIEVPKAETAKAEVK